MVYCCFLSLQRPRGAAEVSELRALLSFLSLHSSLNFYFSTGSRWSLQSSANCLTCSNKTSPFILKPPEIVLNESERGEERSEGGRIEILWHVRAPNGLCFNISQDTETERCRGSVHVLDADGFKLLPLFSIRHEAFTFLIFQTMRGGADVLRKWTVCTSFTRRSSSSSSSALFSLPPQGWDVGTLTVKHKLLRRLPLCCSTHPDASGGAITNPHMQSRLAMHMIPFTFTVVPLFFCLFSALLAMTQSEVFAGRGVNSAGLYRDTCLTWAADCIAS